MSKIRTEHSSARKDPQSAVQSLVVRSVKLGHCQALSQGSREQEVFGLVGTNYFTKWVEAEPLANIRDVDVKRFV